MCCDICLHLFQIGLSWFTVSAPLSVEVWQIWNWTGVDFLWKPLIDAYSTLVLKQACFMCRNRLTGSGEDIHSELWPMLCERNDCSFQSQWLRANLPFETSDTLLPVVVNTQKDTMELNGAIGSLSLSECENWHHHSWTTWCVCYIFCTAWTSVKW